MGKICTQWSQFPRDFWQTEYTKSMENMFWMLYPVLGLLGAKGGRWGAEMWREKCPKCGKISQGGNYLHTIESDPKGFLANRVRRIHGEHGLDVISSTGVAEGKGWPVGC